MGRLRQPRLHPEARPTFGFFQAYRRNFHLVLPATIRRTVFGHMADVRHVHDVDHFVAKELEGAPKKIRIQERAKVANMGHVVHRWPTCINRDGPGWIPLPGGSVVRVPIVQLQHQEFPEVWLAAGRGRTGVAGSPIKHTPGGCQKPSNGPPTSIRSQ